MTKKTGLQYEHTIANELHECTDTEVRSYRCGWSGNSAIPQPDVLVTTPQQNFALELKKTSQEQGFRIEEDDIQQLHQCANEYTDCWFGVKFTRRELVMFDFRFVNTSDVIAEALESQIPIAFNPRVGKKSGSLLLDKPELDDWNSTQSGRSDTDVLLGALGISSDVSVGNDSGFNISETTA